MNFFKALSRGLTLTGDITQVAMALQAKQHPDCNRLAGTLFAILTEDFKVKPGNATVAKIAALLNGITDLFLP